MKIKKYLSLILCLLMFISVSAMPVWATGTDTTAGDTTSSDVPETTAAPVTPTWTIPENLTGNAAVTSGCVGIDAKRALNTEPGLLRTAKGVVLYEMTTGTMVYAKNEDEQLYPASLTKVMTALVALERGGLDDEVTVSSAAVADMDPEATLADLVPGEVMSLENLLYCLMVESANDAAAVIAEHIAGSVEAFAALMNQKATELGCTGTHFVNPHGLHDENHYTTARDMAKIMLAALEYDTFREIYSTSRYVVPATNRSGERILNSTNYLIAAEIIDYYSDNGDVQFIGGKTGNTRAAGRCLTATAKLKDGGDSDFYYLSVVLGAEATYDDDDPTVILRYGHFEETQDLMHFGFDDFTTAEVCRRGQIVGQYPVAGGENSVSGEPAETCRVIVPSEFKASDISFRAELTNGGLMAPIGIGDNIGTLRVWYRDVCVAQMDLLSMSVSKKDTMSNIFDGSVITDDETDQITQSVHSGAKLFVILVMIVLVLSSAVAVYNAVIDRKRRKRRRNRRRSR